MSRTGSNPPRMVSLAIHSRVPVFWPSLRGGAGKEWAWETSWGSVSLSAKLRGLTGQHRRVLDAMFAYAQDSHRLDTGAMVLLVDPYRIDQATSKSGTPWLRGMLDDLKHADVVITETNGLRWHGGIVSEWREAKLTTPLPGGALVGTRPYWVVTISATWMRAYDNRLVVQYRALMPILHALRSGAAYALALMVITHRETTIPLTDALRHVMALRPDMTPRARRKVVAAVVDEADTLAELGIHIQDGLVRYHQHRDIRFRSGTPVPEPITPGEEPIAPATEPNTPAREPNEPVFQED